MPTPEQLIIETLKSELTRLRRFAGGLLAEKNVLARQLEILFEQLKLTEDDKRQLRCKAESEG